MSAYEKVKRAKLSFKGGLEASKKIDKKAKKSKNKKTVELQDAVQESIEQSGGKVLSVVAAAEIDVGIGHAPDGGKKTKLYEDLFPVETKRFGYETEKTLTREEALDIRVKKKADRYCK